MKFSDILNPQFALLFFIVVIFIYIIVLDTDGAFRKKFLNFGPSPNTYFFNIALKSWPQVISVYIIAFLSAVSLSYYQNVASFYLNHILLNPAYKDPVKSSKYWGFAIGIADPIINATMAAITFFVTLTMEFQFIFFQLLGTVAISIPSNLAIISQKKFTFA